MMIKMLLESKKSSHIKSRVEVFIREMGLVQYWFYSWFSPRSSYAAPLCLFGSLLEVPFQFHDAGNLFIPMDEGDTSIDDGTRIYLWKQLIRWCMITGRRRTRLVGSGGRDDDGSSCRTCCCWNVVVVLSMFHQLHHDNVVAVLLMLMLVVVVFVFTKCLTTL